MTNYLLGECIGEFARVEPNENSYQPPFQHVYEEDVKTKYCKLVLWENGKAVTRYLNMTTRSYVEESEISDKENIFDLETALNEQ